MGAGSVGIQMVTDVSDWDSPKTNHTIGNLCEWFVQPSGRPSAWDDETWQVALDERGFRRQSQLVAQLFVGKSGEVIGRMTWRSILTHGVVTAIEVIDRPEVWPAADDLAQSLSPLGLRGPFNAQGIWTEERVQFLEVNPRFSGSTGARALLGYREVEAAVRHFALCESEEDVKSLLTPRPRWVGVRQTAERVVPESWVHAFETKDVCHYRRLCNGFLSSADRDTLGGKSSECC